MSPASEYEPATFGPDAGSRDAGRSEETVPIPPFGGAGETAPIPRDEDGGAAVPAFAREGGAAAVPPRLPHLPRVAAATGPNASASGPAGTTGGAPAGPPGPPRGRRPGMLLGAVAGVLMLGGAVALSIAAATGALDAGGAPDSPGASPASGGAGAGAATQPAAPAGAPALPSDCAGLYTRDWAAELDGAVLNPAWALADAAQLEASGDPELAELAAAGAALTCHWGNPAGGSDRGITTRVGYVDADAQAAALARIAELGFGCWPESGGTRCVLESSAGPDGKLGDSDFFRDGVWFATHWVNLGPDGYTADMVSAVFGG